MQPGHGGSRSLSSSDTFRRQKGKSSDSKRKPLTLTLPNLSSLSHNKFSKPDLSPGGGTNLSHQRTPDASTIDHGASDPTEFILSTRAQMTLTEVQNQLDKQGASNLVVELIMTRPSHAIFVEAVELGIALLEGGNSAIQKSIYQRLIIGSNAEKFFKVFYDKVKAAQQEIKSTVVVNTSELSGSTRPGMTHLGLEDAVHGGAHGLDKPDPHGRLKRDFRVAPKQNGIMVTQELAKHFEEAASATSKAYSVVKSKPISSLGDASLSLGMSTAGDVTPSGEREPPSTPFIPLEDVYLGGDHSKSFKSFNRFGRASSAQMEEVRLPSEVVVMQPILRFLQLLCENHNLDLQNYLRHQNNKTNYNLVSETLMFLDCICGSTTGGLGLLGLYINEHNVELVNQTLETLTEYCQGPCHENQNCIATHESNGIDIIIALILNDINPLGKKRMDLVLELKNSASKLLLAVMESRADSENAERILYNMSPKQLIEVAVNLFHQNDYTSSVAADESSNQSVSVGGLGVSIGVNLRDSGVDGSRSTQGLSALGPNLTGSSADDELNEEDEDDETVSPREVGHNIYILCHQLAQHNKELANLLRLNPNEESDSNSLLFPSPTQIGHGLSSGMHTSLFSSNSSSY